MRKLATIQQISALHPIEGKDRIELAIVKGWQVIVRKGEYQVGDLTIFVEPDSLLPEKPEFEFLRPKKFRIKTMKMGGVLSQGICFEPTLLPVKPNGSSYEVDEDVTDLLGVKKYEPYAEEEAEPPKPQKQSKFRQFLFSHAVTRPLAKFLLRPKKKEWFSFPSFVSKTDETRIQNMPFILDRKDLAFVVREKVDGQSGTFFLKRLPKRFPWSKKRFDFGVCSRNRRLFTPDRSSYWQVAQRYSIEDVLHRLIGDHEWVCIQGECIASNVQGNKYHVTEPDLYCFNLIYPVGKVHCVEAEPLLAGYGLKWAPLVCARYTLPDTVGEMLDFATGQSQLYPTLREGVVLRNYEYNISFKAVSPDFLIKHDE